MKSLLKISALFLALLCSTISCPAQQAGGEQERRVVRTRKGNAILLDGMSIEIWRTRGGERSRIDHRKEIIGEKDELSFTIANDQRDRYLYLINVASDGKMYLLFPEPAEQNHLKPHDRITLGVFRFEGAEKLELLRFYANPGPLPFLNASLVDERGALDDETARQIAQLTGVSARESLVSVADPERWRLNLPLDDTSVRERKIGTAPEKKTKNAQARRKSPKNRKPAGSEPADRPERITASTDVPKTENKAAMVEIYLKRQ